MGDQIIHASYLSIIDGNDNVSASAERLDETLDQDLTLASTQAGLGRRPVYDDLCHQDTTVHRQIENLGQLRVDGVATDAQPGVGEVAVFDELWHHPLDRVDRHSESHSRGEATIGENDGVDPDDLAPRVQKRSA